MASKKLSAVILILPLLFLWGCKIFEDNQNAPAKAVPAAYSQDFISPIALFALEWGELPYVLASGFLVSKENGYFMTARHFTDNFADLGLKKCRVFFGGKIYEASLFKVAPLQDAALLKITSEFNPADFPDPPPLAGRQPRKKDKVIIAGFHLHPFFIREANKQEDTGDILVPIIRGYYGLKTADPNREFEIVFETLEAKVLATDKRMKIQQESEIGWKALGRLRYEANYFLEVRTLRNHRFSFAGLSGTLVVNEKGEFVGIVTAGPLPRLEYDPSGKIEDLTAPEGFKTVADLLDITPAHSLLELLNFR